MHPAVSLFWHYPFVTTARVSLCLCPLGYSVVFLKRIRSCSETAWVQLFLERTLGYYRIFFVGNTVLLPLADQEGAKQRFHLLTHRLKVCRSIGWQQFKETELFRDTDSWKPILVFHLHVCDKAIPGVAECQKQCDPLSF